MYSSHTVFADSHTISYQSRATLWDFYCNHILHANIARTGVRTGQDGQDGQDGQLPRDLHNQGAYTYVLSPFYFWYFRVGWASTAPLLKAAQGPPHVLSPFILWYSRVGWASTAPLLNAAQGPPHV